MTSQLPCPTNGETRGEPFFAQRKRGGDLRVEVREGDALIIVPPFATLQMPSNAAHLLQACARQAGFKVSVLYANLLFAGNLALRTYEAICRAFMSGGALLGERIFSAAAYGLPPLGRYTDCLPSQYDQAGGCDADAFIEWPLVKQLATDAPAWSDAVAALVSEQNFKVVGCTTTFQQTSASIALLNRIKRLRPETITVIGGANCEGEMAEGIASLGAEIDFIFSGESETSWPAFLECVASGELPSSRIVQGEPCMDLDALPTPDYSEFYHQSGRHLDSVKQQQIWLPYESSRGCWWGRKHQCTFCGLNALGIDTRRKSPDRIITELQRLLVKHPSRSVFMVDNLMPQTYLRTLIPRIPKELPNLDLFYEQRPNLKLRDLLALQQAGVTEIQPGIEALSTALLKRMRKGVTASQNIALLRYARSVNLRLLVWNMLYDIPGDRLDEWEETLFLLPLLRHLYPPTGLRRVHVSRFSPYFDRAGEWGVTHIRPIEAYGEAYPARADTMKLAYHFVGDYRSTYREHPHIVHAVGREIATWRDAWNNEHEPPALWVRQLAHDLFVLRDTRGLPDTSPLQLLNRERAAAALVGGTRQRASVIEWALANKVGLELDGSCVPLATADAQLLLELEAERTRKSPSKAAAHPLCGFLEIRSSADSSVRCEHC